MHEKMPCSITDGPRHPDEEALEDEEWDEFKCEGCQENPVQHPGLCEECAVCQAEEAGEY